MAKSSMFQLLKGFQHAFEIPNPHQHRSFLGRCVVGPFRWGSWRSFCRPLWSAPGPQNSSIPSGSWASPRSRSTIDRWPCWEPCSHPWPWPSIPAAIACGPAAMPFVNGSWRPRRASKRSFGLRRAPLGGRAGCKRTSAVALTENPPAVPGSSCSASRMRLGMVSLARCAEEPL